jgi:hypothetical protein
MKLPAFERMCQLRGKTLRINGDHKFFSPLAIKIDVPDDTEVIVLDPGICWTPLEIKSSKKQVIIPTEDFAFSYFKEIDNEKINYG